MQLEEFLKSRGDNLQEQLAKAAEETGFTVMAFRHWMAGRSFPRGKTIAKLQEWSEGKVTAADFTLVQQPKASADAASDKDKAA